ncbi:MAG: twin-arginine translocation signal domain-containing protein [Bacteroidetes bacterium]|nr:twin-arginine translocation signal domain-containing protein [Bacteroidales bacterium]NJO68634.1 twin-arginine translocation signal domain-containing protein [Bacteroidota bacterium]
MTSRRNFITTTGAAAAALMINSSWTLKKDTLENFGFIAGIIGKELDNDWESTLRKVAGMGFTEMETGKYYGESATSFLQFCSQLGISPIAGGIKFTDNKEELKINIEKLHELKLKFAVTYWPWLSGGPFKLDDCRKSAEILNIIGQICKESGLTFCWHNHDKEFIAMEEGMPFDYLMKNTDPSLVYCEMDIYWVKKGGADPLQILKNTKEGYPFYMLRTWLLVQIRISNAREAELLIFQPFFVKRKTRV